MGQIKAGEMQDGVVLTVGEGRWRRVVGVVKERRILRNGDQVRHYQTPHFRAGHRWPFLSSGVCGSCKYEMAKMGTTRAETEKNARTLLNYHPEYHSPTCLKFHEPKPKRPKKDPLVKAFQALTRDFKAGRITRDEFHYHTAKLFPKWVPDAYLHERDKGETQATEPPNDVPLGLEEKAGERTNCEGTNGSNDA